MEPAARRLVVVGSLNADLVAGVARLPQPGETVLAAGSLATLCGGKGANQALAAARLGASTAMVGRVGDDAHGERLLAALLRDGVDCSGVRATPGCATGVALIVVDDAGRNSIVVVPGANAQLNADDVDRELPLIGAGCVVALQLEIPLETVAHAAAAARARGATVVLNPAPAMPLADALLASVEVLVLNESEASVLTGEPVDSIDTVQRAAARLRERGAGSVLVTLGARGVFAATAGGVRHLPARRVHAVDTTGAGDTFIGGLCAGLLEGLDLPAAIDLGQAAAAIQVTRPGAQAAMPTRREVEKAAARGGPD